MNQRTNGSSFSVEFPSYWLDIKFHLLSFVEWQFHFLNHSSGIQKWLQHSLSVVEIWTEDIFLYFVWKNENFLHKIILFFYFLCLVLLSTHKTSLQNKLGLYPEKQILFNYWGRLDLEEVSNHTERDCFLLFLWRILVFIALKLML